MRISRRTRLTRFAARHAVALRRLARLAAVAVAVVGAALVGSLAAVHHLADGHIYQVPEVPARDVALVFGSQVGPDGRPLAVLEGRLEVALRLWRAGRVRAVLVSGDNSTREYDEVDPARAWLVARGVPATRVVGDYAGFDTYSSCVRATRIFGVRRAIVVSQPIHLARSVALCRGVGIDAVGVADEVPRVPATTLRMLAVRDDLASVKASYELLVRPDPRFLGRHETGIQDALADP